ncbi:unnamed protein product [Haemonchus placei]|uniref:Uncharacterized protein n=1 Tax=Haemonchus placei TaxID=6290 RepID=A0A0N4WS89_HAEPC|nr:unnamed protein product [Haemonchus placei]
MVTIRKRLRNVSWYVGKIAEAENILVFCHFSCSGGELEHHQRGERILHQSDLSDVFRLSYVY